MAMTYQGLGMQMSFEDICVNYVIFLFSPMASFSFQEGRKNFNGAIGSNFLFLFLALSNTRARFPHM
jgi:hypothetical protein